MCPNCIRGLKNGELCIQCKGTGFWNPESLSVKGVEVMKEHDEAANVGGATESPATETAAEQVGADVTESPAAPVAEVTETPTEDAGVQAPAPEEVKSEHVVV